MNKIILIGNVGQDPTVRAFENGGKLISFTLATTEQWRDKNTGEKRETTTWHNIQASQPGLIGVIQQYVKKGTKIAIEGKQLNREYVDGTNNKRNWYFVSIQTLTLLGSPARSEQSTPDGETYPDDVPDVLQNGDDDLPF